MTLNLMGAAILLLLFQTVSSAALLEQPFQEAWLTGFEPIVIDGQPVEPACKIITIGKTPPAPMPKPVTTARPITVKRAWTPNPTAARILTNSRRPPVRPGNPRGGAVLTPSFPANGRPAVYNAGSRLAPPSASLPGNGKPIGALAPPGNLNVPFPNYGIAPANPPVPRRAHIPGSFGPANPWASFLWSGIAQRLAASFTQNAVTSSESSEEYRG